MNDTTDQATSQGQAQQTYTDPVLNPHPETLSTQAQALDHTVGNWMLSMAEDAFMLCVFVVIWALIIARLTRRWRLTPGGVPKANITFNAFAMFFALLVAIATLVLFVIFKAAVYGGYGQPLFF